jgi:predicted DNA-binding transcriptional regulator YafY
MFPRIHAVDLAAPAAAGPPPELEDEPGWTRVELRFRSHLSALPLLAFGPDVEVLTPEDLRRALAGQAEATAALYAPRRDA